VRFNQGKTYRIAVQRNVGVLTVNPSASGEGDEMAHPANVSSAAHHLDANGHHCWTFPADNTDLVAQNTMSCGYNIGPDLFVEFDTGSQQDSLFYDISQTGVHPGDQLSYEIGLLPTKAKASRTPVLCTDSAPIIKRGAVSVLPNRRYYVQVASSASGHPRAATDICLW